MCQKLEVREPISALQTARVNSMCTKAIITITRAAAAIAAVVRMQIWPLIAALYDIADL
ncbi:MAG TPA: hypothetical protein VJ695_10635 [Nitrososphaera sp.]|nr:hypothetical protein [Nitrososphaera sp.]